MAEIKIENVSKTYSSKEGTVQALKNVSLTIRSGEIYGIIGMSGAGKSTLVRCMNFLEQPTSGNVLIKGRALGGLKEKELRKQREQIGMIFQHFNLLMQKSVLENVCFPMYIQVPYPVSFHMFCPMIIGTNKFGSDIISGAFFPKIIVRKMIHDSVCC